MATKDTILQVKDSFSATIDGGIVIFAKGETIDADHPAVRQWPGNFGPVTINHRTETKPAVEQATAGPGEKRGR